MDTVTKPLTAIAEHNLPRVLILGQTFTTDTGGGITLGNLFHNWPREKLAVAVESKEDVDFKRASSYYRIGYKELKMPFPFSLFQRKTRCGPISENSAVGAVSVEQSGELKSKLKGYFDHMLHFTGLFYWIYGNQKISDSLLSWIDDFKPDVIYFQPNSYKSLDFAISIKEHVQVPMISHVMDDWFSFTIRPSPLKPYWNKKLDTLIRKVFAVTDLHLSICNYMSAEYLKRYGYSFVPFHNCVDLDFWNVSKSEITTLNNPVKLLYAGRLGYGLEHMILKVSLVIERMAKNGHAIEFEIQTKDLDHPVVQRFRKMNHIAVSGPISYNKLPSKFAEADILLIPCDFDGPGVKFIRYSMPTKVSEYMATDTPILVIGPPATALTEYALEGWAKICLSNNETHIEAAIIELIDSSDLRKTVVAKAKMLAAKNHDQKATVNRFREAVSALSHLHLESQK